MTTPRELTPEQERKVKEASKEKSRLGRERRGREREAAERAYKKRFNPCPHCGAHTAEFVDWFVSRLIEKEKWPRCDVELEDGSLCNFDLQDCGEGVAEDRWHCPACEFRETIATLKAEVERLTR